ncbi:MAG TPA: hypothetical protein HPP83_07510 [Candidatus Hydrogenedentes bacterium]|nr:hypothetical protein [Candidatus Hydrogenedentota bacterium]
MGVTLLKLGKPSPLLPEELVVHEQRRFRAVSSTTLPSYRIGFNLPPLWRISLLVTNRRCLVLTDLFHCMTQEIAMWYPGQNPDDDPETVTKVSCQKGLFGNCLELCSHNPKRRQRWLWSPDLTLRFFLKEPEQIEAAILRQMKRSEAADQPG